MNTSHPQDLLDEHLSTPAWMGVDGVIMSDSPAVISGTRCGLAKTWIDESLGPYVFNLTWATSDCSLICDRHGRCARHDLYREFPKTYTGDTTCVSDFRYNWPYRSYKFFFRFDHTCRCNAGWSGGWCGTDDNANVHHATSDATSPPGPRGGRHLVVNILCTAGVVKFLTL